MSKHRYNKAKRALAVNTLRTEGKRFSLVVADNLAHLKDMPTSKGYKLSPDPKGSHVVRLHFTPLAPVPKNNREMLYPLPNPNRSLTDKQLKAKFRLQDQELYTIPINDKPLDNRNMRKVSKASTRREKWKEVGLP